MTRLHRGGSECILLSACWYRGSRIRSGHRREGWPARAPAVSGHKPQLLYDYPFSSPINLGILPAFLFFKHQRIVPQACCSSQIPLSECLSISSVYSTVKDFRILVPFLLVQRIGKTVNAYQRIRMLLLQHRFPQRQFLSIYLIVIR